MPEWFLFTQQVLSIFLQQFDREIIPRLSEHLDDRRISGIVKVNVELLIDDAVLLMRLIRLPILGNFLLLEEVLRLNRRHLWPVLHIPDHFHV